MERLTRRQAVTLGLDTGNTQPYPSLQREN